jgi:hypothetical protein
MARRLGRGGAYAAAGSRSTGGERGRRWPRQIRSLSRRRKPKTPLPGITVTATRLDESA